MQQSGSGWGLVQTEKSRQFGVFPFGLSLLFDAAAADRNGEGANQDLASELSQLLLRLSKSGSDGVVAIPCGCVIERVAAHQEDFRQFLVVVGHHRRLRRLLRHREKVVNILDGAESLLPELELHGGVKLGKAGIEMMLQCLGIGEVDRVGLVRVFGDVGEVKTEGFAETAELDFALVLQAESEGLLRDLLCR